MTFKARIRIRTLYPFYNGISAIIDECKLNIGTEGITVDEVDLANVCQVSAKLPREMFDSYQCTNNQTIGINLTKYQKIIDKDLQDNPIIGFELIQPSGYTKPQLITRINNTEYKHITLDPVTINKTPKPFKIKHNMELITVPLELLIEGIEAVEKYQDGVSNVVLIGVDFNNQIFFIRSNTGSADGSNTEIRLVDLQNTRWIDEKENHETVIQSMHSMDYMIEIIQGLSAFNEISDGNVVLKLNNDWPIEISIKCYDGFELKYLLAPKIELE